MEGAPNKRDESHLADGGSGYVSTFPSAEATIHAIDIGKISHLEEGGSALTIDTMVAIDYMGIGLVSCRDKFFDIGVIYANGALDMGSLVRIWVADVDEDSLPIS